ncbi:MAG: glycosyltransferase family 4 protein [Anaerolineales bacterium]|nr:glycosyltransferase family 4 protein [Anaerolineales bacterium]
MRILNTLYYYRPHFSGLTVYTERLARMLVSHGHQVTVLTSQYDPSLQAVEKLDGVDVKRIPVAFKVAKGPIMPTFLYQAARLIPEHDILHLHVPQLEAAPLSLLGRAFGVPVVLTYHCDLLLPPSPLNALANRISNLANSISTKTANAIIVNSRDYAEESPLLSKRLEKVEVIPPPIEMPEPDPAVVQSIRERFKIVPGNPVIGMAARLATEKGAEVLAQAMPLVLKEIPSARVLYVGQYENVIGEDAYRLRLLPQIESLGDHWIFLGNLQQSEFAAFFKMCAVTVLPSLNSTESFGMVQVESMLSGTPVVASDLPGVRQPTQATGMGLTFPAGDAEALAAALLQILRNPADYTRDRSSIMAQYSSDVVSKKYETVFAKLNSRV